MFVKLALGYNKPPVRDKEITQDEYFSYDVVVAPGPRVLKSRISRPGPITEEQLERLVVEYSKYQPN